jgi:hypothetical protein
MRRTLFALLALPIAFALAACGTMIQGRVYTVPAGHTLQFAIQRSYGHGKMEATDPQSGEKFSGEYSGFYTGQDAVTGHVGDVNIALYKPPTGANAYGILAGDKGTTIRLYFVIAPGLVPSGHGTGVDQHGTSYEAFF